MNVKVSQDVLNALREAMKHRNRSAVRIELGGFG